MSQIRFVIRAESGHGGRAPHSLSRMLNLYLGAWGHSVRLISCVEEEAVNDNI